MSPQLQLMLQQAIQAFQDGNFSSADLILKRVLLLDSKCLPALHILGLIKASQSKYREAVDYLSKAVRIQPNDPSIQYNLAKALSDSGNDKDALIHHKKAVTLAPNNPEAWLSYGKSASNLGRYDDALIWYGNALSLKPDYAEALLNTGATLKELKRYEEAIAFAAQALVINPDLVEAWSNKGVALKELKRYEEAITHYDKAISLKPDYHEAWTNKGISLKELKRYEEAITHYDKAISLKPDYHEAYANKGVVLHELKRYDEAIDHYDKALSIKPGLAENWSNKGATLNELKRYDEAIAHYDKALNIKPDYHVAWVNKGVVLHELKRYEEAITHYDKALILNPEYHGGWASKGVTLHELKRYEEAITHYDKAISLKPDYHEAWTNKGISLKELKRYEEAITHYDKAISLKPDYHEAYANKGVVLHELKRYDEAIDHYDKALIQLTENHEVWVNKGVVLYELKRYDEAIAHYDKALNIKPDYHVAWVNKGVVLHELKRYEEAITHYDKALILNPEYHGGWASKGVTLHELKRYEEAITHYDKALDVMPNLPISWANKGATLNELKRYEEAISHYEKALSLDQDIDWICGDLLQAKMKICSWSGFSDNLEKISEKVLSNKKVVQPFQLLALIDDAALHKKSSEIYALNKFQRNNVLGFIPGWAKKEKIRIGYFSADFRHHPVSILAAELFELHDKNRFEIFAFSFGVDDKSPIRIRLSQAFDRFIDVSGMSDIEVARLSRDLKIDIAVDLGGYTSDNRTGIFSYRAAPIQVIYLGYLGTMGIEYFDYILADKTIITEKLEIYYSEKIVYLPSYQVNDRKRIISDKAFTRRELGLPENSFIFCCFNNNYKLLPATFRSWMRILKVVKNSALFLYAENKWVEENLKKEAKASGIDDSRLVFGGNIPTDEYLARYRVCDLFLDTAPYNAGTTASDALWAGIPILTLKGQSFASRMAASLLNAVGLPELITDNQEDYEALAIELALNTQKLSDLKLKLNKNRFTTALFNTPLFTKNLETAYIKMMERYEAGLQPDNIHVNQVVP